MNILDLLPAALGLLTKVVPSGDSATALNQARAAVQQANDHAVRLTAERDALIRSNNALRTALVAHLPPDVAGAVFVGLLDDSGPAGAVPEHPASPS